MAKAVPSWNYSLSACCRSRIRDIANKSLHGQLNCIMNHIAQAWNGKLSSNSKSPTCARILSSEDVRMPALPHYCSWKSRMLAKVKECRDAIRNMMTFDKLSISETARRTGKHPSNSSTRRPTTSVSSIPDIITFSSIALKHKEYGDELILMRNSMLHSDEEKLNASTEQIDRANTVNDSYSRRASADNTMNSSLKSFLALEKQIKEEFPEEEEEEEEKDNMYTIKKKISAEPFLSYAEGTAEFIWNDDTTEESFSGKAWNSLEHLNASEIGLGIPRNNSTFCENNHAHKNRTSSPIKSFHFQDSGFENNFSI